MAVYDFTQPLREQLDDAAIMEMIRTHTPELLKTFTLEEVLTPNRVIALAREGKVTQDTLVTYCAHYPYLQHPPAPLTNDINVGPKEGGILDVYKLTDEEYKLVWEIRQTRNF